MKNLKVTQDVLRRALELGVEIRALVWDIHCTIQESRRFSRWVREIALHVGGHRAESNAGACETALSACPASLSFGQFSTS